MDDSVDLVSHICMGNNNTLGFFLTPIVHSSTNLETIIKRRRLMEDKVFGAKLGNLSFCCTQLHFNTLCKLEKIGHQTEEYGMSRGGCTLRWCIAWQRQKKDMSTGLLGCCFKVKLVTYHVWLKVFQRCCFVLGLRLGIHRWRRKLSLCPKQGIKWNIGKHSPVTSQRAIQSRCWQTAECTSSCSLA